MLLDEARWIRHTLGSLEVGKLSPLLNVGSSTAEFRERVQPWIDEEIFAPLRRRGVSVHHLDIQQGQGIDLHGDLDDETFVAGLREGKYHSLLCCNVLEHLRNPAVIVKRLEEIVPVGGYLLFTVPNQFPFHPDPIDTMFRPDLGDLVKLFTLCKLVEGEMPYCGSGWDYVERDPRIMFAKVKRRLASRRESGGLPGTVSFAPWLFRRFRMTCALFERIPEEL
jgi:hypothetical protein